MVVQLGINGPFVQSIAGNGALDQLPFSLQPFLDGRLGTTLAPSIWQLDASLHLPMGSPIKLLILPWTMKLG